MTCRGLPVVVQFPKSLTTKDTRAHEGNIRSQKPSCSFAPLVVQHFVGRIVKLHHYRITALSKSRLPCQLYYFTYDQIRVTISSVSITGLVAIRLVMINGEIASFRQRKEKILRNSCPPFCVQQRVAKSAEHCVRFPSPDLSGVTS
jgi:hypothetical protein